MVSKRNALIGLATGIVGASLLVSTCENNVRPISLYDINGDSVEDVVSIEPSLDGATNAVLVVYDGATSTKNQDGSYIVKDLLSYQPINVPVPSVGNIFYVFGELDGKKGYNLHVKETTPDFPVNITHRTYNNIVRNKT